MKAQERRQLITEMLIAGERVSVAKLSELTGKSEMTIRRDLETLEALGAAKRIHGGAISPLSLSYEPPYEVRTQRAAEEKQRIGKLAASLIAEGETVILDVGTTVAQVATALKGSRNITVLTYGLRIADLLYDEAGIRLMLTGGTVRSGERSLDDGLAERAFTEFVFDTFVMGIAGIHGEFGLTDFNLGDVRVKKAALSASRRCIVVADSSKLGRIAFAKTCAIDQVDVLITDDGADRAILAEIEKTGVEIREA